MKWNWLLFLATLALVRSALGTPPATLYAPASDSTNSSRGIPIIYSLPVAPASGTVEISIYNTSVNVTLFMNDSRSNNFTLLPGALTSSSQVVSASASVLPDGQYGVLLTYRDTPTDTPGFAQVTNVLVKSTTTPPVLLLPASGTTWNRLPIQYELPDAPTASTVRLAFFNSSTNVLLTLNNNASNNFLLNPSALASVSQVLTTTSPVLPDGVYSLFLSYQDYLGNPAASTSATNIQIKTITTPPILLLPTNNFAGATFTFQYELPDAPFSGSVRLIFFNSSTNVSLQFNNSLSNAFVLDPASLWTAPPPIVFSSSPVLPDGAYTLLLSYQDYLGNPAASTQATNLLVQTHPISFPPGGISFSNGYVLVTVSNLAASYSDSSYHLLFSPNLTNPLSTWQNLGAVTGALMHPSVYHFQFIDPRPTNSAGFYMLRGN